MTEEAPATSAPRGGRIANLATRVMVLPVLSPLSAGPVVWVYKRGIISRNGILFAQEYVYKPIEWLCRGSVMVDTFWQRDLALWP